jgi:transaldolase
MIFASTGAKIKGDPEWKYVEAFAGSDIETNPPKTNAEVQKSGRTIVRRVDELPPAAVLAEIDRQVNVEHMESTLMSEGVAKFADPHKALLQLIESRRSGSGRE